MDFASLETTIPFEKELKHTKTYAEIEKLRFDNITFEFNIEDSDFEVPALVVQPMVENAVRHGIDTQSGEGVVTISTRLDGDRVIMEVTDNGTGEENETPQQAKHRGIGISNTKERIRRMCNGDMDIIYTGRGTIVRYTIPLE